MDRPTKEIIERLGPNGLSRVLDDLLDQKRLVHLANTCGLKYRGMRTQSQTRDRLVEDLAKKARKEDEVAKAVLRVLAKEAAGATREWAGLDSDEKIRRLSDEEFLRTKHNAGLHLYLLSAGDAREIDTLGARLAYEYLLRVSSNGANTAATGATRGKTSKQEARLVRQVQARDRKLRHLEAQLVKSREAQKSSKQDLIQRKGELAESRMLAERLQRELSRAESAARATANPGSTGPTESEITGLTKTMRQLVAAQKKLVQRIEPLADKKQPREDAASLHSLSESLKQIGKRATADTKQRDKQFDEFAKRIESLRTAVRARPASGGKPAKRARPKGTAQRVGVFIDVQNVYYGARRLKGKLDFDALLEAATDGRRLIQTTAYVVETKETDQSQFLARLRKHGIEVRRKTLQVRADGSMKGDWDMELALDILDAAPLLDVVVLVSGDGDFTSLVKRVKSMGPRVEVIAFPRATAKSLVQAADTFQPLDRKFMIYARASKPRPKPPAADKPQSAEKSQSSRPRKPKDPGP